MFSIAGFDEVQKISLNSNCKSGYYRLAFASSGWSSYSFYDAQSDMDIPEALPTVGDAWRQETKLYKHMACYFLHKCGEFAAVANGERETIGLGCVAKTFDGGNEVDFTGIVHAASAILGRHRINITL